MAPLLTIVDLSISFQGQAGAMPAVNGISLTIFPGQTLAVVGESGCGKSLTALAVIGLTPPKAKIDRGQILLNGRDLSRCTQAELRAIRGRDIAMIFQEPMTSLNPVFTIGDQLSESIYLNAGVQCADVEAWAIAAMQEVGISEPSQRLKQYPHELSGGMRQRVMIAMALAGSPNLLLADEPTTALDVTIQAQILKLLRDIQRRRSMGIMLITHDLGIVAENADIACVVFAGRVVEYAAVNEVFAHPRHPYTKALLECRPQLHSRPQRLMTVSHAMASIQAADCDYAATGGKTPWWPNTETASTKDRYELVEVAPNHWAGCIESGTTVRTATVPQIAPIQMIAS
jgi:oligopeptide/dipeptide ABC transporter ATP-binding protein